jgi:hypothetical protein
LFTAGVTGTVLLAACGGSHVASGSSSASLDARSTSVLRAYARCVRAHGLEDFPDPQIGSDGVPRFPDSAPRVPVSAQNACRAEAQRIPADYTATTAVSTADFQKLLRFARCVRAHGIPDWPDPNALGEFPITPRIEAAGKRLIGPGVHACARLNPTPGGGVHVVSAG